jgi:outer membrane receptor protein involved in Fe transport
MCRRSIAVALLVCSWMLGMAPAARAQSADTGTLGTVANATGAVLPGADVTVTNKSTGVARTIVSGSNGAFELRYLLPGDYTIDVMLQGFRAERRAITLRIGQMVRLDFVMQIGDVGEVIDVVAQGQLLETQSAVTGGVVTGERIVNLPLNGRNFVNLGNLTAGVIAQNGAFSANGSRTSYQQISFDGVSAINNRGNALTMFPSVDAVEEFKVQSSNYTAEYGGHAGANVQVQFKSGTNVLHGSVFDFVRNDAMDARNFFTPAPRPKPTLDRQQFGGVIGGPIVREKTFFMVSYQGLRETRETAGQANMLTAAMRNGDFSALSTQITDPLTGQPFQGNIIPKERLNPTSLAIVNTYQPLPNQTGSNNFSGVTKNEDQQNQFITRIDHVLSSRQKIFGHYMYDNRHAPQTPLNPNFVVARDFRNQSAAIQHVTTISNNMVNEAKFGYMRGNLNRLSPRRLTGFTAEKDLGINGLFVGGPNGRPLNELEVGFPSITISGYNGFGDSTSGEGLDKSQTYQFVETVSWIKGAHGIKMGGDLRRMMGDATSTNSPFGQINFTRDIAGDAAAAFMLGFPRTSFSPEGIPVSGVRQWRYGLYVQDDWRVTQRLTVNLGVRYDRNFVPKDTNGVSRTLRFDLDPNGPVLWPQSGEVVDDLYFNKHLKWSPRLGAAYRLRDDLVLRGGYGIFVMAAHLDQLNTLQTNPPTASIQTTNPTRNPIATIQNPFPAALVPSNPIFNVVSAEPDRNHQDGYYQNWNVSIGYELSRRSSLEVRYAGAKGSHLDTSLLNFNSPDPDPTASALNLQARRPYPAFGRIRMWATDGNSNYQALQTQFRHDGPWGLSLTSAYTWAHLIDDQAGGLNGSRSRRQNPRDQGPERANSNDDVRQRLVVGYVWEIPFGKNLTNPILSTALKGWQFSGIVTLSAGSPVHITQDGDVLNTDPSGGTNNEIRPNLVDGQDPNLPTGDRTIARWFNTAAFARATQTYGTSYRNPVIGPGLKTLDLSLSKSFEVGWGHRVQFRWEAFNALNTAQFANPDGTLGSSTFGEISGTRSGYNNREMQLSLKYLF